MEEIENPVNDLSLAPEHDTDLPDEESKPEIMPDFIQFACVHCNLPLLELLGAWKEHIVCRCSKCGGLTYIRLKPQQDQIKMAEMKIPMGVG